MAVKMIVSDLDGTLLNGESKISIETEKAIKTAQNAGIRWVTATGRSVTTANRLLQSVGVKGEYVLLNGAEFRDFTGNLIYEEAISWEYAKKLIQILQKKNIDFEINTDEGDYSSNIVFCNTAQPMPKIEELLNKKIIVRKIFGFSKEGYCLETVRELLKQMNGINVTSSAEWNIEITTEKAQKGIMVERVMQYFGYTKEQVVVFGDGQNDESMFRRFPHTCAMGNAINTIKNIAEKTVESNTDDGVAKEIRRILNREI